MCNSVSPDTARMVRNGMAFLAASDELTRAGHAALLESSSMMTRQALRLFCALHAPSATEDEVEAGFDNLPL